jgi:hypothetical protein
MSVSARNSYYSTLDDLHLTFYFILDMECLTLVQVVTTVYIDASNERGLFAYLLYCIFGGHPIWMCSLS